MECKKNKVILNENLALIEGRDGFFLVNRRDIYVGQALEKYGEYGFIEAYVLNQLVRPGDAVIEVGANIGSHTVGLAKHVGVDGKVFAYEPQRPCFALLQSQIALNQLTNVYAFNQGVGDKPGTLYLPHINYNELNNFGGVSLQENYQAGGDSVEVIRLDDYFQDQKINVIKVDVEGMEYEVLKGAHSLIKRDRPILYVENDRVEKSKALIEFIIGLDYRLWWNACPLYNADNFFADSDNIYKGVASFNMLCVPKSIRVDVQNLIEINSSDEEHPMKGRVSK